MLVLSRRSDESVIAKFGDIEMKVTVVEIRGDKVRLGFEAPKNVPIHRAEIWDKIQSLHSDAADTYTDHILDDPEILAGPQDAQQ